MARTASSTPREWPCAVSMTITSQPACKQRLHARLAILADTDGGADAQPAVLVLDRLRMLLGLLDVLDGDEPLHLARARRRRSASRCGACAGAPWRARAPVPSGTVISSVVITSRTRCSRLRSKRTSRLVRMPTGLPLDDDRQPGDAVLAHELAARACSFSSGWTTTGSKTMPLSAFLTLCTSRACSLDGQVLVDDAEAAFARHGDGGVGLGDGVHRRGDQRHLQRDALGQPGAHVARRAAAPRSRRAAAGRRRR